MMSSRKAILVVNATRSEAVQAATTLAGLLSNQSFELFTSSAVKISGIETVSVDQLPEAEIVIVLGGDGTQSTQSGGFPQRLRKTHRVIPANQRGDCSRHQSIQRSMAAGLSHGIPLLRARADMAVGE
jgi:hypothetical protein